MALCALLSRPVPLLLFCFVVSGYCWCLLDGLPALRYVKRPLVERGAEVIELCFTWRFARVMLTTIDAIVSKDRWLRVC